MKKQALDYFENMKRLNAQGAPIDWYKVAEALAAVIGQLVEPEATEQS